MTKDKAMSQSKAIRSGISVVMKNPSAWLAEVIWHWAYDCTMLVLVVYSIYQFLDSLVVSDADVFALGTGFPPFVSSAMVHIFHGTGPKMVMLAAVVAIGMAIFWLCAATLGRAATLTALLPARVVTLGPIFRLNLFRVLLSVLAGFAVLGAALLAHSVSQQPDGMVPSTSPDRFQLVFLPLWIMMMMAWSSVSWYLVLAPLLAALRGTDALSSLLDAHQLVRGRGRQFAWVGFGFWVMRLVAGVAAFVVFFSIVLGTLQLAPIAFVVAVIFWAAAYSLVLQFLNLARLAAILRIMEWDGEITSQTSGHSAQQSWVATVPAAEPQRS